MIQIKQGKKPKSIICKFDEKEFTSKPKTSEVGAIKNRIQNNTFTTYKTIKEIQQEILKGKTCIPSAIKGNVKENWKEQQVFLLDIDNKIEDEDIKVEDDRHITVEKAVEICKQHNLEPTFIYNTFSNSEKQNKFRLVFIFEEAIENLEIARQVLSLLHTELQELDLDTSKKNLSDMFFAGKEIAYTSNIVYKVEVLKDEEKEAEKEEKKEEKEEYQTVKEKIDGKEYTYKIASPYLIINGAIYKETDDETIKISHIPVFIVAERTNIDNGEEKLELAIKKKGKWKRGSFLKSQVYNGTQADLSNFGIPISNLNNRDFIRYLTNMEADNEETIEEILTCNKLGWRDDKFIPFSNNCDIKIDLDNKQQKWINAYKSKGTLKEWVEAIKPFRKNNIFRFMMASSFTAPLLTLIGHRIFIVFNWGNSRAGKSSALKAALSVWGNPDDLTLTFNTTAVGIERLAGLYNDLPLGLDEKSINKSQSDIEKMIYMLGNGISRIRGNKTGGIQEINTWNTVVLATGEETISTENSRTGIQTRTLEIEGSPYDYDEQKASGMYYIIEQYYGTAGPFYINKLIEEYSKEDYKFLKQKYKEILSKVKDKSNNDISSYITSVSIVTLADILIGKWLFDEDEEKSYEMAEQILNSLDKSNEIDLIDKCYDYITSWILSNHRYFDIYSDRAEESTKQDDDDIMHSSKAKSFGIYERGVYYLHSSILVDKLKSAGYASRKILSEFGKRGYIVTSTDENGKLLTNTVQKKIRGKNARMYAFPIEDSEEMIKEKEEREKRQQEEIEEFIRTGTTKKMEEINKEYNRLIYGENVENEDN